MNDRTDTVGGGGSGFSSDLEKKQSRVWRVLTPVLLSLQLLLVYTGVELGLARQDSRWLPAVRAATLADYTGLWPDQPEREPLSPEIIGEIIADEMETGAVEPAEETASQEEREAAAESLLDATPVPVTPTPTPSPTPTPGASVTAGSSPTATATPSRTPIPTASETPRPSATVTSTPTASPTPSQTLTPSPTLTVAATWTPTLPSDCISGGGSQVTGKEVRWDLTNHCASDLSVTQIYIDWPASNQRLDEIKLGGSTIWDQQSTASPTIISSGWTQEPVIEGEDNETLKFRFKKKAAAGPYQIKVTFSNGDSVSLYIPGGASTPTPTPTNTPTKTPTPTVEPTLSPSPDATAAAPSEPTPTPIAPSPVATP